MRVGYIQYDVQHNPEENFRMIEACLVHTDVDVVVLPELSVCGYLFGCRGDLLKCAEAVPDGASTKRMLNLSAAHHCVIIFGLAERIGQKVYNTAVIVDHGKYIGKYQKMHLSDFEKTLFERGDTDHVFDLGRFKIGVQICFDLWFPEVSRAQMMQGADLFCVLANFGGETTYTISQTRAIENLTPLVMCNRVGFERTEKMDATFLGKSTIIDSAGHRLSTGREGSADCAVCEIQISQQKSNVICADFYKEILLHDYKKGEL